MRSNGRRRVGSEQRHSAVSRKRSSFGLTESFHCNRNERHASRQRRLPRQGVERALHATRAAFEYVRVDHRRRNVLMAEQLLHGPNVAA